MLYKDRVLLLETTYALPSSFPDCWSRGVERQVKEPIKLAFARPLSVIPDCWRRGDGQQNKEPINLAFAHPGHWRAEYLTSYKH